MTDEHSLKSLLVYIRDMWERDNERFHDCYYLISEMQRELIKITDHFEQLDEHPEWLNETECNNLIKESRDWMRKFQIWIYKHKEITIDVN